MTNNFTVTAGIRLAILPILLSLAASAPLAAQHYSYLPTGSTTDDRFLSLAGGNIQTLGDNPLVFKIASPACSTSVEIGVFDGETSGIFDQGSVPLIYTLYADPEGNGTGTTQLGQWSGDVMNDNNWYTIIVDNNAAARCGCGDYFYTLKVQSSDAAAFHWSSFKLRTTGTIAVARASNLTFSAPLASLLDASVVYPSYPSLTPTTYDGTWNFHMDIPNNIDALEVWDGDFDRGSYDCSDNDTDDEDTPNEIPSWATATAVAEGTATSSIACQDAAGNPTGGTTTSNPPDNSRNPALARGAGPTYDVIVPSGTHSTNDNPSGNLEWEQFRISTENYSRSMMDYHADALPSGGYDVAIAGMDLGNLNALRFPYDVSGVDADGAPVTPIHADYSDGSITGTVYFESGGNCTQGLLELGIPLATVRLAADYNGDGATDETWCTASDLLGHFSFGNLHPGAYTITVDAGTLPLGCGTTCDSDGSSTPNKVCASLSMCSRSFCCVFGYKSGHGLLGALER